jgi:Phosphotransferase enzyme family
MTEPLPNPERFWKTRAALRGATHAEIEARIGRFDGPLTLLSGGLANSNVLVDGRVLRIYRRDPRVLRLEVALLSHPWSSFRVPQILATGQDFILLEYVSHGPVLGSAEHGAAVGEALAEIHALSFEHAGFLTPELRIGQPFPDLVTSLLEYARSLRANAEAALGRILTQQSLNTLAANAVALRAVVGKPVLLHADFKASNLHWTQDARLLVLDWEFAYSGSRLSDFGQLLRWPAPEAFVDALTRGYLTAGGTLPERFQSSAALLDLVNLIGLAAHLPDVESEPRVSDVRQRIELTLAAHTGLTR